MYCKRYWVFSSEMVIVRLPTRNNSTRGIASEVRAISLVYWVQHWHCLTELIKQRRSTKDEQRTEQVARPEDAARPTFPHSLPSKRCFIYPSSRVGRMHQTQQPSHRATVTNGDLAANRGRALRHQCTGDWSRARSPLCHVTQVRQP